MLIHAAYHNATTNALGAWIFLAIMALWIAGLCVFAHNVKSAHNADSE